MMRRRIGVALGALAGGSALGCAALLLWLPLLPVRVFGGTPSGAFFERDEWWGYARLHPRDVVPVLALAGGWGALLLVGSVARARGAAWGAWPLWGATLALGVRAAWVVAAPERALAAGAPPSTAAAYLALALLAAVASLLLAPPPLGPANR